MASTHFSVDKFGALLSSIEMECGFGSLLLFDVDFMFGSAPLIQLWGYYIKPLGFENMFPVPSLMLAKFSSP
jgi:hypothetical protein